ncbi:MAG: sensor histidine kinase [Planctomycetota bacterium]|jgi:two-component system NtrC family sensor kinase
MGSLPDGGRLLLRHRLALRLVVVLCLGSAAIIVALGWWNVRTQRDHMIRLTTNAADRCSEIIRGATRDGMLHNELEQVDRILASIGTAPGIDRIRVFDRKGRVHSSTDPADRGQVVDASAFQCRACHTGPTPVDALTEAQRVLISTAPDGTRRLDVIAPIYNEPACSSAACHAHPPGQRVLGVIDVQMPLGPVEDLIRASEHQLGLGLLLTLTAIVLLAGLLIWIMVVRPVRALSEASGRVAAGDFDARVPVQTQDEIGRMSSSWNRMVDELATAHREIEAWNRTLEDRVDEKTRELAAAHQRMLVVEKMAALGKLAAVVAHEINNPLAGIATYAKLLRRHLDKRGRADGQDQEDAKILHLVESEAARCGKIVRNLLLFSRTPGAKFSDADLEKVIRQCALLINHQAKLQGVDLEVDIHPDVPHVSCDASQIQQVVLALMMNALEAMPSGGTLSARLRPFPGRDEIALEVEDTGCGIRPEDLPHVFEPFFSTKEQGEGVGLGLSVVYGIVHRHHGEVSARSDRKVGTTFTVRLPTVQPAVEVDAPVPMQGDMS